MHHFVRLPLIPHQKFFPRGMIWQYDIKRFTPNHEIKTIFDVGANIGQTALGVRKYFPDAEIYSFEPIAATFQELQRNTALYQNIRCIPFALGSEQGIATASVRSDSQLATLVQRTDDEWRQTEALEQVRVRTVDDYCNEQRINRIDVLKMDVQGYELEVLRGAKRMLDNTLYVFAEVGFHRSDHESQYFPPFHDYVQEIGFDLCGLYDHFRWSDHRRLIGFCNALYLTSKARPR